MIKKIKVYRYSVILIIIACFFMASILRYGFRTFQVPEWDEQYYMQMATSYYRLLQHPSLNTPNEILQIQPVKQPGYPLFIVPFLLIFGLSHAYVCALVTNGLFYVASIFGIYILAKRYISSFASFLAAIIFAFYGWTLYYVHLAYSETATSALCLWTIVCLMKSNYFQNKKYSYLFGLFFGVGLLTRWITILFIFGPLLLIMYQIVKKRLFTKAWVLVNGAIIISITLLVSLYPYYRNAYWVYAYFSGHRVGGGMWQIIPERERNLLSSYSLTFYLFSFEKLGIFLFMLFIAGFLFVLKKKNKFLPIILTILIPWIFFSFFSILKADRFIIPIYPYIALVSGSVFDNLKNRKFKILLTGITLSLSVGTYFGSVWGKGPMKANLFVVKGFHLTTISHPPYIYKMSGNEILVFLSKNSKKNNMKNPQILSLFYYRPLDEPLMTYNLYNQEKPFQITNYLGTIINNPDKESGGLVRTIFNNYDYVLMKSGRTTDDYFPKQNYRTLHALIELFQKDVPLKEYYEEMDKIWITQDSSIVTIYKKKKNMDDDELEKMRVLFTNRLEK